MAPPLYVGNVKYAKFLYLCADRRNSLFIQRLKVAYVNKERAAQHEESRLLLGMEQDKDQAIADKARRIFTFCPPHDVESRY